MCLCRCLPSSVFFCPRAKMTKGKSSEGRNICDLFCVFLSMSVPIQAPLCMFVCLSVSVCFCFCFSFFFFAFFFPKRFSSVSSLSVCLCFFLYVCLYFSVLLISCVSLVSFSLSLILFNLRLTKA